MAAVAELAPVGERERALSLDVLRSLALWGVMMGNFLHLYSGRMVWPAQDGTLDAIAMHTFAVVGEQKAMMLLTLLFGFGFANILVRAKDRGVSGTGVFVRRLVVLFLLGWGHVIFVMFGDITWGYAIAGFGLLLFRNTSNTVRLVVGFLLTIVPFTLWSVFDGWRVQFLFLEPGDWQAYAAQHARELRSASYVEMLRENVQFALVFQSFGWPWLYPSYLGRFVIGYVAGAQRWFDRDGADRLPMFKRFVVYGLLVGIPCVIVVLLERLGVFDRAGYELRPTFGATIYTLHQLALAAAYTGIVVLLVQRPPWRRVLSLLAPAGRMPLTTYVMQSVFAMILFSARGFAWRSPPAAQILGLCVVLFPLQILIAHLWLRRFRFGPLEWLWRSLVYAKRQPMRV